MNRTGNLDFIKNMNRSLVLEIIREQQPISRADVAKKLGLSRSTVTLIVNDLLDKKFLFELGLGDSTKEGGRRGMELGFNPKSGYGIGVDIGRTKTFIVITDLDGEIHFSEKYRTTESIDSLITTIKGSIQKSAIDENLIMGIGIGLPGIVNSQSGSIIDVPALNWESMNVIESMKRHFRYPVFVNNDVNLAALGERWLGGEEKTRNLFYIAIGEGVGSAIIANGELVEGQSFSAGEINCFVDRVDVKNNRHQANTIGAFEQQVSGLALSQHGYTAQELFYEYQQGNPKAKPVVDDFVLLLSITLANVISLLNPQKVIIGGGVSESLGLVIDNIRMKVSDFTPIPTQIELARLGGEAGALGAVAYVFEKLQEIDIL